MKTKFKTAAVALLLAAAAVPAAAQSLDRWAAEHFNRGVAVQDRQTVPGTISGVPSRAGTESFATSVGISTAAYDQPAGQCLCSAGSNRMSSTRSSPST